MKSIGFIRSDPWCLKFDMLLWKKTPNILKNDQRKCIFQFDIKVSYEIEVQPCTNYQHCGQKFNINYGGETLKIK